MHLVEAPIKYLLDFLLVKAHFLDIAFMVTMEKDQGFLIGYEGEKGNK